MISMRNKPDIAAAARRLLIPFCLVVMCISLFSLIHYLQGTNPLTPSAYNTYTLQAMQWRKGEIALDHDYPHLELAVYQGRYYVSFPPVPTVPIYLLTFLFGENVPETLLIQMYAIAACLTVFGIFRSASFSPKTSAVFAFLSCFASSLLPMLQNGAVWYQAQVLGFLFTVLSIERMQKGKPTASLLFYALSVGCRPFNALYGPLLLAYGLKTYSAGKTMGHAVKKMLPGFLAGLIVAILYAAYNYVRFGNILEFGHNYLPEFSTQGGIQFALKHIPINAPNFVWGLPFLLTEKGLEIKQYGFSMFLANPILACLILRVFIDIAKRQLNLSRISVFVLFLLHALLLLSHRTCGGYQYGARYFVDCIPYVFMYIASYDQSAEDKRHTDILHIQTAEYVLLIDGLMLSILGSCLIHL